jgi:hypothetical protein
VRDIVAAQRAVATLVWHEDERSAWRDDPQGWAASRLAPEEAAMIAGLSPRGVEAMSRSYLGKKERFDFLHKVHHDYEHLKEQRAAAAGAHAHDGHVHPHSHDHPHDHDHDHDHDHEGAT